MLHLSVDSPKPAAATLVNDWLEVSGWASGTEMVTGVHVALNGGEPVRARYGDSRSDVAAAYPDFVSGRYSGFGCHLRVPAAAGGAVVLSVDVTGGQGGRARAEIPLTITRRAQLPGGERTVVCPGCAAAGAAPQARFQRGPYRLHLCGDCGLGFIQPLPDAAYLKAYYDETYWQSASQRPRSDAEHYDSDAITGLIRAHHPAPRRVLEIGCGPGTLLAGLRRRGFEVKGQDFSAEASRLAREVFDLDVRVAPLGDPPDWPCDAIVLRHVIEHSPSPCADLERASAALRPGGLLVIVTPNIESLAARMLGASWNWFVPPAHLFYFSPTSLSRFAATRGLEVRHVATRRGDGIACAPALAAFLAYERPFLLSWEVARLEQTLALLGRDGATDGTLGALGLGNEVVAVLARPQA